MAKNYRRGRRRRPFNLRKVRVVQGIAVGALATLDVLSGAITASSAATLRLVSVNLNYKIVDLGSASDDGQEFGLAHSDYSAAEIEECLEASASIDAGNHIEREKANRLVRSIGTFVGDPLAGGDKQFNDGKPMKTKLNWLLTPGDTLHMWIRNGSATVYTTGAAIIAQGDLWVRDSV